MAKKLVVLGGGPGGLIVANLLADYYETVVVDRRKETVFQPGQLFVAFKGESPNKYKKEIKEVLNPKAKFIQSEVTKIDLDNREVLLKDSSKIRYEYLVVSLGVEFNYEMIEGLKENFEKFGDYYSGLEFSAKFYENFKTLRKGQLVITVADPVYKCVPAPHKGAALAADTLRKMGSQAKVVLTVPFPKVYPAEKLADEYEKALRKHGVEIKTMFTLDRIDHEEKKIYSLEGEELSFDLLAVIPPHKGPSVEVDPSNVRDSDGYFKVDEYKLNIIGYDDAFAIGDNASLPTAKSGVGAHLQAEVVADNLLGYEAKFNGRTFCPCISNDTASFVISDYDHPPVRVRCSRFKRLIEEVFIAGYWSFLKYPRIWRPLMETMFEATKPSVLGEIGW
uniref:NAD(P)/FAD-dependent oxidoreductase n=1 Tax=Fervidicoccus fontis TaxID=683846 RepID=A0A7C1I4U4_9CREN